MLVVIIALHGAARFDLAGPAGWRGESLDVWLDDPVLVIATVARWLALGLAYYLAMVMFAIAVTADPERVTRIVPAGWLGPIAALVGTAIVVVPLVDNRAPEEPAASGSSEARRAYASAA